MASTGLLTGINPYKQQRTALDISSKPLALAVQLEQKEQAKAEALEKYFMDYEKSINPKGLGRGEGDIFAKKYNQIREYWIKNKDAILHPTKYGYDAQSTYMAGLKDALGYIDQAKQATAERKAFVDYINKQKANGKHISDNYLEIANNAMKPVGAGYIAPDMSQIQIYDPHNEKQFTTNVWGGIKIPTKEVEEQEIINKKPTGKVIKKTYEVLTDDVINNAALGAVNEYRNNRGTKEYFDELFKDKSYTDQINQVFRKKFNKDISNGADLAIGYALTQKPGGLIKQEAPEYSWISKFNMNQAAINARADKYNKVEEGNLLDAIPDIDLASGGKITSGIAYDKTGKPLNGKIYLEKTKLPNEWFSVIGNPKGVNGFDITFVDGSPEVISNKRTGTINRQSMINYQRKYNTEPKNSPGMIFGKTKTKGSSGINWKK